MAVERIRSRKPDHEKAVYEHKSDENQNQAVDDIALDIVELSYLYPGLDDCLLLVIVRLRLVQCHLLFKCDEVTKPLAELNVEKTANKAEQRKHQANGTPRHRHHVLHPCPTS